MIQRQTTTFFDSFPTIRRKDSGEMLKMDSAGSGAESERIQRLMTEGGRNEFCGGQTIFPPPPLRRWKRWSAEMEKKIK